MVSYKDVAEAGRKQGMSQSEIDQAWGKYVNYNNKSASSNTSSNSNVNNVSSDRYGDSSKVSSMSKNTGEGVNMSTGLNVKPTQKQDLGDMAIFGQDVYNKGFSNGGSLAKRNDIIANNLYLSGEDTETYLNQFDSFRNASDVDKANTIRAINERIGAYGKKNNNDVNNDNSLGDDSILKDHEDRPGYYYENGNYYPILGYNDVSDDYKKYMDQMSDADRKRLSNEWAADMQGKIKLDADLRNEKDYKEKMFGLAQDMRKIQEEQEGIQYEQTLRQSREQVDNLIQNWEYLGNMGMPGLSKTKLQAISDSIGEAEQSYKELRRLEDLSRDASAKGWEIDVAQYTKQIEDITRELNYKIPQEIQNALNKYTVAELDGKLDTIDGVVAFKRSLLEELDNNISGLTEGSLNQMKYITDTYMQMADKAYEEAKLYRDNKNVVNTEMSSVKGYYVDGNGDAILDSNGLPIKIPQGAPMDPVFDKETGKLIQFGYDENGNITASVTQVYSGDQSSMQATIISLLEQGVSTQDILKYVPGADLKQVQELEKVVNVQVREDGLPKTYNGKSYNATTQDKVDSVLKTLNKGGWGGQCGFFVNNYLEDLGVGRLYSDPITDKTKNINSMEAKVGNVVVMDSPTHPEYGHVGIVTAIDENGNMTILQSNRNDNQQIYTTTKNINDGGIYGFFDPRKSIDEYNSEGVSSNVSGGDGGYNENGIADFTQYWTKGRSSFTDKARAEIAEDYGSWKEFERQATNYKSYINGQVGEVARDLLFVLDDMYNWLTNDDGSINTANLNALRFNSWVPGTEAYTMNQKWKNFKSSTALQKLINLKKDGATFGALSDNELGFITEASTWLDKWVKGDDLVNGLGGKMNEIMKYYKIDRNDIKSMKNQLGYGNNGGNNTVNNGGNTGGGDDVVSSGRGVF